MIWSKGRNIFSCLVGILPNYFSGRSSSCPRCLRILGPPPQPAQGNETCFEQRFQPRGASVSHPVRGLLLKGSVPLFPLGCRSIKVQFLGVRIQWLWKIYFGVGASEGLSLQDRWGKWAALDDHKCFSLPSKSWSGCQLNG